MFKKIVVVVSCVAFLCGSARAQDAKTVIANAQKALGDVKSITYSGSVSGSSMSGSYTVGGAAGGSWKAAKTG